MGNNLYIEFVSHKNLDTNKEYFGYSYFDDNVQGYLLHSDTKEECDFTLKEFLGDLISNEYYEILDIIEEHLSMKKGLNFRDKYFNFNEIDSLYNELKETYEETLLEEARQEEDFYNEYNDPSEKNNG